jgi:hypothetical protein
LAANQRLEVLLDEVENSAIFVAIGSPAYLKRDWTRLELQRFCDVGDVSGRLFAIECLPLDDGDAYPTPLSQHKRLEFWAPSGPMSKVAVCDDPHAWEFLQKVHDLAEQIKRAFRSLAARNGPAADVGPRLSIGVTSDPKLPPCGIPNTPLQIDRYRPVVVAQVTDDLEDEVKDLRRYLSEYGVPLAPEDEWPLDPSAFQDAFRHTVMDGALFVQLLGPFRGKAPNLIPEGFPAWQLETAVAAKAMVQQWRHPELDLSAVKDPDHLRLLTGAEVIAEGFESFKANVLRAARMPVQQADDDACEPFVFIDAQGCDEAIADRLLGRLQEMGIEASRLTKFDDPSIRAELRKRYEISDGVCWVYGAAEHSALNGRMAVDFQRVNKMRKKEGRPFRALAVYKAPPPDKPGLGVTLSNLIEIEASDQEYPPAFDRFVQSLTAQSGG